MSNDEVKLLFALRSRTVRGVKRNFKGVYKENLDCPLMCWGSNDAPITDTQEHMLVCSKLNKNSREICSNTVTYNNIFSSDVLKQKEMVKIFEKLIDKRNNLLEDQQ